MKKRNFLAFVGLTIALHGCASSKNLEDDGTNSFGGGYRVLTVQEGLFYVEAKTNFAPWRNYGTARKMWNTHSTEACGGDSFIELNTSEYDYQSVPSSGWAKYIISVKDGYAFCKYSETSQEEAEKLVQEYANSLPPREPSKYSETY